MMKEYDTPIALCQYLEEEDVICTSSGLSVAVDTDEGYGPLIPLG